MRKCRKSWLTHGISSRRVTHLPGVSFSPCNYMYIFYIWTGLNNGPPLIARRAISIMACTLFSKCVDLILFRDFVNLRRWEKRGDVFLSCNVAIEVDEAPPKKGHIRWDIITERQIIWIRALDDNDIQKLFITKFAVISPFERVGKKLHLSVTCEVSHEWLDFYQAPKNLCAYKERWRYE